MIELTNIVVERFFTKYVPDPEDKAKSIGVDYVTYGPLGSLDKTKTTEKVARLAKVQVDGDSDNPSIIMAKARWDSIRPKYEAFKEGREVPMNGTPLAAWNLLQAEDCDLLKQHKVYTIEEVAALSDSIVQKIGLANGRSIVEQAKLFLKSADTTRAAAEMADMQTQMAAMRAELDEAKRALIAADDEDDSEDGEAGTRKRPGRKTNAERAALAAQQEAA